MALADYFERTPEWPQEIGTDPEPSRNLRVALLLGPQSADRSVMHSKRPGDIR